MTVFYRRSRMPAAWIGLPHKADAHGNPQFCPYIRVCCSQPFPRPIFAAVITGAPWRWLQIPDNVLTRTEEAQLAYVRWRCRFHYREMLATAYLFGDITAFEFVKSPSEVLILDTRGRLVGLKDRVTPAGSGTLRFGERIVLVDSEDH